MPTIIDNWINRSEMDYYTMFIKAWIPFNAWYMLNFYDESVNRTTDRSIIDYIKDNSNRYRDKIISLLESDSEEAKEFRGLLSKLHYELEDHPIPNFEKRVSFANLSLNRNAVKQHSFTRGNYTYKCEFKDQLQRTQKRFFCEVLNKNATRTLHLIELHKWSLTDLNNEQSYIAIGNNDIQSNLRMCFNEINPDKPIIIIIPPKRTPSNKFKQPNNSITIDIEKNLFFTDDKEKVTKAIIQLIYDLRCKLFHGELEPTNSNSNAYKYAYQIQKILIKELN